MSEDLSCPIGTYASVQAHIIVHPDFERHWPYAPARLQELWEADGHTVGLQRLDPGDDRPVSQAIPNPAPIERLASLSVPVSDTCHEAFPNLEEAAPFTDNGYEVSDDVRQQFEAAGVTVHEHENRGYWGQSVAETALGLTISALRKLPHKHAAIIESQDAWDYTPDGEPGPGKRAVQYADDPRFVEGTIDGKNVRMAGIGNIGSRYADTMSHLGADVAAYDPYADEPCFHRAGARRVFELDQLVQDADIFAPMMAPTPETEGLITADLIDDLPQGCLVLLVTRARVVDSDALRERVCADELLLAADVWDENGGEPLALDDPILGRENVVHTPHLAGRTRDANEAWAERLDAHFD